MEDSATHGKGREAKTHKRRDLKSPTIKLAILINDKNQATSRSFHGAIGEGEEGRGKAAEGRGKEPEGR